MDADDGLSTAIVLGPGMPAASARSGRLGDAATNLVLATVLVLAAAVVLLLVLHTRVVVIRSGSMTPTYGVGEVVLSRSVAAGTVRPGDVVTFHDPGRGGILVTHRVRTVTRNGDQLDVETRGDANSASERWTVPVEAQLGLAGPHAPGIGWAVHAVGNVWARIAGILLGCLTVAYVLLRRIWDDPDGPAARA